MHLTVREIHNILEEMAPAALKESYDNVGLMIGDFEEEVSDILIALDCTMEVIEEAKILGCNLILTHHPLLFLKPSVITTETLIGRKIIKLIKNNINVYASHTNLDIVHGGLNDIIAELLGFRTWEIIELASGSNLNSSYGVGRLVTLEEPWTLRETCEHVKKMLNINYLKYAGSENMVIRKIAIVNGSGEDYFKLSKAMNADCIITGDTTYHYVSDYVEDNMAVIDAGHFETEWPLMQVTANRIAHKIKELGFSNKVIISKASMPVYKFI